MLVLDPVATDEHAWVDPRRASPSDQKNPTLEFRRQLGEGKKLAYPL